MHQFVSVGPPLSSDKGRDRQGLVTCVTTRCCTTAVLYYAVSALVFGGIREHTFLPRLLLREAEWAVSASLVDRVHDEVDYA